MGVSFFQGEDAPQPNTRSPREILTLSFLRVRFIPLVSLALPPPVHRVKSFLKQTASFVTSIYPFSAFAPGGGIPGGPTALCFAGLALQTGSEPGTVLPLNSEQH